MALIGVVLGDNCVDRYLPPIDRDFAGGQAVNVAAHLARLGLEVAYAGVVGDDGAGAWILDQLRARGLDVGAVERRPGPTGVTTIETTLGGERRFVTEDYGVSAPYDPTDDALGLVRSADLVYLAHVSDIGAVVRALPVSACLGVDTSDGLIDPATLIAAATLFVSRPQLDPATATAEARGLVSDGAGTVVVTMGARGAVAASAAHVAFAPAAAATAVDTLGAGDALAATFLARRMAGDDLETALRLGGAAAAEACGHIGALP